MGREVAVVCLGTGTGTSHVYDGKCSAAYVLTIDRRPVLLVGAGGGTVRACIEHFGAIPDAIFIPNNRSHQAAELPTLLSVESSRSHRINVIAHVDVCRRLQTHRLAELHEVMTAQKRTMDDLAAFIPLVCGANVGAKGDNVADEAAAGLPDSVPLLPDQEGQRLRITIARASATELSFGLVVSYDGQPLVAFTGDSGFDAGFYGSLTDRCPVMFADGRQRGSADHASFADITNYFTSPDRSLRNAAPTVCVIGQYGDATAAPAVTHSSLMVASEGLSFALPDSLPDLDGQPAPTVRVTAHNTTTREVPQGAQGHQSSAAAAPTAAAAARPASVANDSFGSLSLSASAASTSYRRGRPASVSAENDYRPTDWSRGLRPGGSLSPSRSPSRSQRPGPPRYPTSNPNHHVPRRVHFFSNENRAQAPVMMMVQSFRDFRKMATTVAEKLGIVPAGRIFFPDGSVANELSQLTNDCAVVVTKHGGEPFVVSDPPILLKQHLSRRVNTAPSPGRPESPSSPGRRATSRGVPSSVNLGDGVVAGQLSQVKPQASNETSAADTSRAKVVGSSFFAQINPRQNNDSIQYAL